MKTQRKIAIYVRTASHDSSSTAELARQETLCREFIGREFPERAAQKGTIVVYRDLGSSAMDMKRSGLVSLLEDANLMKIEAVVVTDLVRFYRRPVDMTSIDVVLREAEVSAFAVDGARLGFGSEPTPSVEAPCRS